MDEQIADDFKFAFDSDPMKTLSENDVMPNAKLKKIKNKKNSHNDKAVISGSQREMLNPGCN